MGTIAIFWAAVFALIFFILGLAFKLLTAAFKAVEEALEGVFELAFIVGLAVLVLCLIFGLISESLAGNFVNYISVLIVIVIFFSLITMLLGNLLIVPIELAKGLASIVLETLIGLASGCAAVCDRGYAHFLNVIIKRAENC